MILTKKVEVTIVAKNIKHYLSLGYKVKYFDKITVPVEHLTPQSNKKVKVKCDICGKEKELKYQTYMFSVSNGGFYACSEKCAWIKNRKTNLERYGCESPMGNEDVQEKSKQTCLNKYGVKNIAQSNYFKDKYKKIMLNRYGVENSFQAEEIKEKIKQTWIEKYGFEHYRQNQKMKDKYCNGENSNFWIDGRSYNNDYISEWCKSHLVNDFRRKIFGTREKKCICCGECKDVQLHHLNSRNKFPEQTCDEENVVIICKDCHNKFHNKYGYGDNTKEQFEDFINKKN